MTTEPVWCKLDSMVPGNDFYRLLSNLLQQTAQNPDIHPTLPLDQWPPGSSEQLLLEDLQAALAALQAGYQKPSSQTEIWDPQGLNIFEIASDGLIIHDLNTGIVVDVNPAACTMYGYAREEFIGQNLHCIHSPG